MSMSIDWAPIAAMAAITVLAALGIFGIFALGVHAQTTAEEKARNGQPSGTARLAGYGCFAVAAVLVAYGLLLFVS